MGFRPLLLAIVPIVLSAASEREIGLPYLRNYPPREYRGQAQNWAITQDQRGVIYIGNNDGVLLYDGVRWHTVRAAHDSAVRSLDVDAHGTVYVGGRGEFGYLAVDESGSTHYVSLLERVPASDRGFKDILRTIATPDGVYFGSNERLFRWNPQTGLNVWKPAEHERFYLTFREKNALYVQESRAGLMRLERDALRPVRGGERFAKQRIYCVADLGDKLLVGVPEGMYLREGGSFTPYATEADALLRKAQPFACRSLPGGGLAVTTLRGGAVLFNSSLKIERILNESSGLSSDAVTAAFQDREGGLWLALVSGVARVEARAPLSVFDERNGLAGSVTAIARHEGLLYAGTTTGVYRLKTPAPGEAANFEPLQNINEEVLALLSTEAGLLIGAKSGVYQLQGKRAKLIRPSDYVYDLSPSRIDPGMIYASGKDGLALLRKSGGRWLDGGKIPGIDHALRKAVETPEGVWLGTDSQGLLLVSGLPGNPSVENFGTGAIVPVLAGSRVVFLSAKGIESFDPKTRRFSPDTALAGAFTRRSDQPTILVEEADGKNIWVAAKSYGGVLHSQAGSGYK
jgi:ligand-binding sensor domain-containing protein